MKKKLLVLEDQAEIKELLQEFLGDEFELSFSSSMKHVTKDQVDLVLSDLHLEDGNPSSWLHENYSSKNIPVFVYSGLKPDSLEDFCVKYNFKAFLPKPLVFNHLHKVLKGA